MAKSSKAQKRLKKYHARTAAAAAAAATTDAVELGPFFADAANAPPPPPIAVADANPQINDTTAGESNIHHTPIAEVESVVTMATSLGNAASPPPSVVATSNAILQHDNRCTLCGLWGKVLECETCPRVFHLGCTRPRLKDIPDGIWRCPYCKSLDNNISEEEQQLAHASKDEIEALSGGTTGNTSSKRPLPGQSADTSSTEKESEKRPTLSNSTTQFVESFFGKEKTTQKILLNALLTDQRVSEVLPAQSAVATNIPNPSMARLSYNRQMINVSDSAKQQANRSHGISLVSSRYKRWHPSEFR